MENIVIATTVFLKERGAVRETLSFKMVEEVLKLKYKIVVVYKGKENDFIKSLKDLGVVVKEETGVGMGQSRRQALAEASQLIGKDGVVVWTEPEKHPFIKFIPRLAERIKNGEADLVVPMRNKLDSYPKEQQEEENLLNLLFEKVLKRKKADLSFGPRLMGEEALSYFLNYEGEYGDKWDSIFIPILRVKKAGLKIHYEGVPYIHPEEQTGEEEGDLSVFMKRIEQFYNLATPFYEEGKKIGLI